MALIENFFSQMHFLKTSYLYDFFQFYQSVGTTSSTTDDFRMGCASFFQRSILSVIFVRRAQGLFAREEG